MFGRTSSATWLRGTWAFGSQESYSHRGAARGGLVAGRPPQWTDPGHRRERCRLSIKRRLHYFILIVGPLDAFFVCAGVAGLDRNRISPQDLIVCSGVGILAGLQVAAAVISAKAVGTLVYIAIAGSIVEGLVVDAAWRNKEIAEWQWP
jgi:hypothetical protein